MIIIIIIIVLFITFTKRSAADNIRLYDMPNEETI